MTTNVYDIDSGTLASDSRWSAKIDDRFLFYVDDTDYDKIVFDTELSVLFAGSLVSIDVWKQWFVAGRGGPLPNVFVELSICVADMKTGDVEFDSGNAIRVPNARFAGTGAGHAQNCWQANKSAQKAVETASGLDNCTGGKVVYLERQTSKHNTTNTGHPDLVAQMLADRGNVMDVKNGKSGTPIKSAVNDPEVKAAFDKLQSGNASLCAPFSGMGEKWTEEKKAELGRVLSKYAPKK